MERHDCPPLETITAYVSGCLHGNDEAAFESHVSTCSSCAQQLQQEACFEMALHEAADHLPPPRRPGWVRRWSSATTHGMGAIAAAASVLLTLGLSTPWLDDEATARPSKTRRMSEARSANDGEHLSCVPAFDEPACEEPLLLAQRETTPVPWTELPEPIDPATCWSEDEGVDLVCTSSSGR